jgi:hypothetical protein
MAVSHAAGRGGLAGIRARIVLWRQLAIGIVNVSDRLTAPPARARRGVGDWLALAHPAGARSYVSTPAEGPPRPKVEIFAQSVHLFLAAIAQGMPVAVSLEAFGTLGRGSFSVLTRR